MPRTDPAAPLVTVALDAMAYGPEAIGTQVSEGEGQGRRTFVFGGAPGERVRARVTRVRKGAAHADLVQIEQPSPARVVPECPLFGTCGGCQWQHLAPHAQRDEKRRILARALGLPFEDVPMRASPSAYLWRGRARLHLEDGRLGFRPLRGHGVVDVPACPVLDARAGGALAAVRTVLLRHAGGTHRLCGEVLLDADAVALRLEGTAGSAGMLELVAQRLVATGAVSAVSRAPAEGSSRAPQLLAGVGDPARALRFEQANPGAAALLRAAMLDAAGPVAGRRVLELYAGAGHLTTALLGAGASVVAVENDPAALPALATTGARVEAGEAGEVVARLAAATRAGKRGFDLVVVDPPRTGIGPVAQGLMGLAAPRLVYVSCDPMTLRRDVEALRRYYEIDHAEGVDLFPQTYHVEAVVTLRHR